MSPTGVAALAVGADPAVRADDQRSPLAEQSSGSAEGQPWGIPPPSKWIAAPREATRRDALDAAALATALVDSDPQRTLDLLETARTFDPHNELLYRDIMRLQEKLGHLDAIPRTLTLLTTRPRPGRPPTATPRRPGRTTFP